MPSDQGSRGTLFLVTGVRRPVGQSAGIREPLVPEALHECKSAALATTKHSFPGF